MDNTSMVIIKWSAVIQNDSQKILGQSHFGTELQLSNGGIGCEQTEKMLPQSKCYSRSSYFYLE